MEVVRIDGGGAPSPAPEEPPVGEPAAPPAAHPLVLVTWRDAWFDFDQADEEDPRADYLVRTVGFVVREGPRFVSVAQEVLPDGDGFRAVTHIPRSVIEGIVPLHPLHQGATLDPDERLYSADHGVEATPDRRRDA